MIACVAFNIRLRTKHTAGIHLAATVAAGQSSCLVRARREGERSKGHEN